MKETAEEIMAPPGLSVWSRAQRTLLAARGVADLQGLAGPRQPAHAVQRRPRPDPRGQHPGERAPVGRADARRGARPPDVAAPPRDDPLHADDTVPGAAQGVAARHPGAAARADQLP